MCAMWQSFVDHSRCPKDIGADKLNFIPVFWHFFVKLCWKTPSPVEGFASKPWSFSSACKNFEAQHLLGAEIWLSKKSIWVGYYILVFRSPKLLDQSSPDFFVESRRNRGRSNSCLTSNIFISSGDSLFAVVVWSRPKARQILHVLAPKIIWEKTQIFGLAL